MKRIQMPLKSMLSLIIVVTGTFCVTGSSANSVVSLDMDWPAFMARQDLIWETLPTEFDTGAFMGNGMLGSMIYKDGPNRLRWEMGRSDVTEHRRDNARLPIGGLVLTTLGDIQDGTLHLDLWNAEVRGTIQTNRGSLTVRSFIHYDLPLARDDEALLFTGDTAPAPVIRPIAAEPASHNPYGMKKKQEQVIQ